MLCLKIDNDHRRNENQLSPFYSFLYLSIFLYSFSFSTFFVIDISIAV